jgi:hypothetical protein
MKLLLILTFFVSTKIINAQNLIEWSNSYQLQLSDFQSPATQIGGSNIYSLHTAANLNFSFSMSNAEFMFTKNFNSKISCTFNREAASIIAPDSATAIDLLYFARYEFDLSELYARKLRKKLYEEKAAFSSADFFRPASEEIQKEFNQRHAMAAKAADIGKNREKLNELHNEVLKEIEQLADFCKQCKPPKKKK